MAHHIASVAGSMSGRLGDIVFRLRCGRFTVSTRPRRYRTPEDRASVDRRSRFAVSVGLARALLSIPDLTPFWKAAAPDFMPAYNFMIRRFVRVVDPGPVTRKIPITPGQGFTIVCNRAVMAGREISVSLAEIGDVSGIDLSRGWDCRLAYIICMSNPVAGAVPEYSFTPGSSEKKPLVPGEELKFSILLSDRKAANLGAYRERNILLALVIIEANGALQAYSDTAIAAVEGQPVEA